MPDGDGSLAFCSADERQKIHVIDKGSPSPATDQRSWLPQPAWFSRYAVARQLRDPSSTLQMYRDALQLRRKLLSDDAVQWIGHQPNSDILQFTRSNGWQCIVNFSDQTIPAPPGQLLLSSHPDTTSRHLPADSTTWLQT
jgi:alpha-glucosidase